MKKSQAICPNCPITSHTNAVSPSLFSSSEPLWPAARLPRSLNGAMGTLPTRSWLSPQHTHTNTHERDAHAWGFQRDPTRSVCVFNFSLFSLCLSSKLNAPDIPLDILLYSSSSSLDLYSCFSVSVFSCVPDISLINTLVMNYIVVLTGEPTRAQ